MQDGPEPNVVSGDAISIRDLAQVVVEELAPSPRVELPECRWQVSHVSSMFPTSIAPKDAWGYVTRSGCEKPSGVQQRGIAEIAFLSNRDALCQSMQT